MSIEIGKKIYNYVYGSMTVVGLNEQYIFVTVDSLEGISEFLDPVFRVESKQFFRESLGHWVFLDEKEVVKTESDAPVGQGQSPKALVVDPRFINDRYLSMFGYPEGFNKKDYKGSTAVNKESGTKKSKVPGESATKVLS